VRKEAQLLRLGLMELNDYETTVLTNTVSHSDYDVEPPAPNSTEPVREAVDLSDLLKVLAARIEDFKHLLVVPRSVVCFAEQQFYASTLFVPQRLGN